MVDAVAVIALVLMILHFLYGVFIAARDGILRQRISRYGEPPGKGVLTGKKALLYGWFSVLAGSALAALCVWALVAVLR
jgi:hypothetical protein